MRLMLDYRVLHKLNKINDLACALDFPEIERVRNLYSKALRYGFNQAHK